MSLTYRPLPKKALKLSWFVLATQRCPSKKISPNVEAISGLAILVIPRKTNFPLGIGPAKLGKVVWSREWPIRASLKNLLQKAKEARYARQAKPGQSVPLTRTPPRMRIWRPQNIVRTPTTPKRRRVKKVGELKKWRDQDWVRIGTDGKIKGACGTSKNKKNPDRCLPRSKAKSLTQSERAATARKKKKGGAGGEKVVPNTKRAKVKNMAQGGVVARGCGAIMNNRRKVTKGSVTRS